MVFQHFIREESMHRKQRVRLVAGVVAGPLLIGACGPDSTAPAEPRRPAELPAAVAAKGSTTGTATVAIEDALTRLVGSFDAATAASLKGPLTAVSATLKSGDLAALPGALAVARQVLASPLALNDARAPDLAAISLALDAAASAK
jgi:hypothetical protein